MGKNSLAKAIVLIGGAYTVNYNNRGKVIEGFECQVFGIYSVGYGESPKMAHL